MIIKIWYILMSSISFILFFDRPIVQIIYREFLRSCRILFPSEELAGDILIIGWKIYFSKYSSTLFYDGTISRQNYSTITISNKNCKSWVREKCKKRRLIKYMWSEHNMKILFHTISLLLEKASVLLMKEKQTSCKNVFPILFMASINWCINCRQSKTMSSREGF